MPRDYNINISVEGGNRRGAFGGGSLSKTKSTLNSNRNLNPSGERDANLSRIFTIGLAFNKGQQANELFGAYTQNKLRQRKTETGLTFAKYAIGVAINPAVGATYALGDLAYRGISYGISVQKQNRESRVLRNFSGNNSSSGSRYQGGRI